LLFIGGDYVCGKDFGPADYYVSIKLNSKFDFDSIGYILLVNGSRSSFSGTTSLNVFYLSSFNYFILTSSATNLSFITGSNLALPFLFYIMSLAIHLAASFLRIPYKSPFLTLSKSSIIYCLSLSRLSLFICNCAIVSPLSFANSISFRLLSDDPCPPKLPSLLSAASILSYLNSYSLLSTLASSSLISSKTYSSLTLRFSLSTASLSNSLLFSYSIAVTLVLSISLKAL
jgi:hypothetical protein